MIQTIKVNGVTLGVEHFGDAAAPLVLLAGGPTMLSWPDALCEGSARRTSRRALRPARLRRLDDHRPRGSGVHTARPRRRRGRARPRARRPARPPGGHRRRRDGRPGRRARPPGRVLGAHPRRNPARRTGPGRRRPARPRRRDDAGCSPARCPTGPTALPWRSSPPPARRSSATTPLPRGRQPSDLGPDPEHGTRGPDGQPAGHRVLQARLQAAMARAPARARDTDARGARSP